MTMKIDVTKYPNLSKYLDPETKAKIKLLVDFTQKSGYILCTKTIYHVDNFGDTDISYNELPLKEAELVVMRFLKIDPAKLEEERKNFIDNELNL